MVNKILLIVLSLIFFYQGFKTIAQKKSLQVFDFEESKENSLPDYFQEGITGVWKKTQWLVRNINGNKVLAHIGFWEDDPDGVFPVCWIKDGKARDFTLSVKLYPVHPPVEIKHAVHDGAGIIFRFKNTNNYYLLRSVPLETRVRLYKVVNGKRKLLSGKNLEIELDKWHELKIKIIGQHFTAYFNGEELFKFADSTFSETGAFGLWCKPNNVTYFDDLSAEIIN